MLKPKKTLENIPLYQTDEYFEACELKLDGNENSFGVSPKVLECLSKLDFKDVCYYPFYGELLDELSKKHLTDKKNILLTNGCDEAISVVFSTYLEAGDSVVSFAPTFSMPKIYANVNGAKFIEVKYRKKWVFEADYLASFIDNKTKIIHLTSPNSPTGDIIKKYDIISLLEAYTDIVVVLDVTYGTFVEACQDYFDLAEKYSNLIIVKSFSKDYALAGLRLGYIVTNELNIQNIKKVISPYSVNTLAVKAGLCVLQDSKHLEEMKKDIIKSRKMLIEGVNKLGFKAYESECNFVLCDFGKKSDYIYKKLLINSIKVRRFKGKEELENCFRVTVPKSSDVNKLLSVLSSRSLLVCDLDGVIFDVSNSYRLAIEKTFEHFSYKKLNEYEIADAKNLGGLNNDWDLTEFLLKKYGVNVDKKEIVDVFQKYFFNPLAVGEKGLIDNEKMLIDKYNFEKLAQKYDICAFTGRPREEALYSLQKFGILKYFNMVVTMDDIPFDKQKPNPFGLNYIKNNAYYSKIYYLGDTKDDMNCAKMAGVSSIGVVPPLKNADDFEGYKKMLLNSGADVVIGNISEILNA